MRLEKTFINPNIEIHPSRISGKGMFAKKAIKEGELIISWGGTFFTTKEAKNKDKKKFLVIQIDNDLWSIEKRGEYEDDYFINHSCDANTWMVDGRTFVARADIRKGEEVTIDHALFESEDYVAKWTCNCKKPCCRTRITGKDCLQKDVQQKYKGHFSPVVQRRIDMNR
ncbi:TPA: SET domain-containing protein [Candidatus Woesearchaeota archaeon]|nr:SET domain-containing protein [Candidatus Woesearchaeota archaeon]